MDLDTLANLTSRLPVASRPRVPCVVARLWAVTDQPASFCRSLLASFMLGEPDPLIALLPFELPAMELPPGIMTAANVAAYRMTWLEGILIAYVGASVEE